MNHFYAGEFDGSVMKFHVPWSNEDSYEFFKYVDLKFSINPLPDDKILDPSKLKEFADDNLKFDENGRKLSKQVENTGEKEKLIITSNFSFSDSVFKRLVSRRHQKVSLSRNGLKVAI